MRVDLDASGYSYLFFELGVLGLGLNVLAELGPVIVLSTHEWARARERAQFVFLRCNAGNSIYLD